ncbi:MAG: hypothetical protein E7329_10915 [Clostridiales bacterium]|nr:hypothetical protein [Clostridiales bacterium]
MKKITFITLLLGVLGTLLFGIGLCMCLLPQWNLFTSGVCVTAVGALALIALFLSRWIMAGKPTAKIDWKKTGKIAYAAVSALVLGLGMALVMVWEMMLPGMLVGVLGIVMLLCLIPLYKGLK